MPTVAHTIRAMVPQVAAALSAGDLLPPDLRRADPTTIAAVTYVLIGQHRVDDPDAVLAYLRAHGCRFSDGGLDFIFRQFDGDDPDHCLWRRDWTGRYYLLVAWAEELFDEEEFT